jgi:hypothetical protein
VLTSNRGRGEVEISQVENAGETTTPAVGFLEAKRGRDILGVGLGGESVATSTLRWGHRVHGTRM